MSSPISKMVGSSCLTAQSTQFNIILNCSGGSLRRANKIKIKFINKIKNYYQKKIKLWLSKK